jgi:hypothetical protein
MALSTRAAVYTRVFTKVYRSRGVIFHLAFDENP